MQKTLYCLASSEPQANDILAHLRKSGFSTSELSVLLYPKKLKDISMEGNAVPGTETGGLVGGARGPLAALTWFLVPVVGPFVASGWFVAALGGAAVGEVVGGLTGGIRNLTLMGIPENAIPRLRHRLYQGAILIAVHSGDPARRGSVLRVFKSSGADYSPEEMAA